MIYAAILWTARGLAPARGRRCRAAHSRERARLLVLLVLCRSISARWWRACAPACIYNTWPLIDGALVPDAARLLFETPLWRNFFENTLTVQFDHRMVAYAILIVRDAARVRRARTVTARLAWSRASLLASAVTLQAALGIVDAAVTRADPLALAHQAMAMVVLTVAATHAALVADRAWSRTKISRWRRRN